MESDWLRWVGLSLGIITLTCMWARRHVWLAGDYQFRLLGVSTLLLLLASLYGLAEAALREVEVAPRTAVIVAAIAMTLFAVLKTPPRSKLHGPRSDR